MSNQKTKIVFFGTPEFAALILKELFDNNYDIAAVVTQPDKKIGRQQELVPSPVKKLAEARGVEIMQPKNLKNTGVVAKTRKFGADLFVVAAYGRILPKTLLEMPKFGAINVHASLLPKYRGASPIQCAIREGEKKTGVTLIRMNEEMDEGDILAAETVKIGEKETTEELMKKLAKIGSKMIVKIIPEWISGKISPTVQSDKKATYCKRIKRDDGRIIHKPSGRDIMRAWRAYHPWPGIYANFKMKGKIRRVKFSRIDFVPEVKTGGETGKIIKYKGLIALEAKGGIVVLKKLQVEGKKELPADDFLRGYPEFIGSKIE